MDNQGSIAAFLTRFINNLFVAMLWFAGIGVIDTVFRLVPPSSFSLFLPITLLAVLLWTCQNPRPVGSERIRALLQQRKFEKAFNLARNTDLFDQVTDYLKTAAATL